jgi:hypothetical protein
MNLWLLDVRHWSLRNLFPRIYFYMDKLISIKRQTTLKMSPILYYHETNRIKNSTDTDWQLTTFMKYDSNLKSKLY